MTNSATVQQLIFKKPSQKYSSQGFERRYQWSRQKTSNLDSNGGSNISNESHGTSIASRRRSLSYYSELPYNQPDSVDIVDAADTLNTADVSDTPHKDTLAELEEASESSTIGDQEDQDDHETINGDKQAGDSDSTFRNIQLDEDILNAITADNHDDEDDQTSLKHTTSNDDLKSVHDTHSIASTTDQSFVSAKESLETASSAISFHSTTSNVQFPSENGHRKGSIASSSLHSHISDDEVEAKNAANALPVFNVDSNDAHNSVDQDDIADTSADTSPANTTVDSIFDNTHVSFNESPSTEFNSVVSSVSPKEPQARKRNISAQSETPTIRAPLAKNLPPVPPKRERRRVASTPTRNVDDSTKRQSNETIPDRPSSRLILPSEFIKLRNGSASSSIISESTKYPKSTATSTSIRPSSSMTSRPRSWTVSGAVQSRRTSQVMKPTTFIDQMLPNNALGLERTMLSVSVTSGAADKLAKSSNRSVFSSKSNKRWQKRRSLSWSAGRSNRNYTAMQFNKPMITLGLSSHSKPPEKLDPHSVLIRVHSTALDNFDALTLMRGTGINNFALEEPPGPEYGFIPGRMVLGQVVEVGLKVKNLHRQEWVWSLLSTEKSGCLSEYVVVNRNRVAGTPVYKPNLDLSKLATVPLKAFVAQTLSNSHMNQLKRGSRILVLTANSNPYNSISTYIIEELKLRKCQIFVQTTSYDDFDYGANVYELHGGVLDVTSDQLEGSFEMVIDARLCWNESDNLATLDCCRRILCRDGAFITLIPEKMDVEPTTHIKQSKWKTLLGIFSLRFRKQTKRIQKVILDVAGDEDVDQSSGMDIRDRLEEIAHKINVGIYSTFLKDQSASNSFEVENATTAFHTLGFNEKGTNITGQPMSDTAIVKMRY